MSTIAEREARARQFIAVSPEAGRREIARRVREADPEGKGLRDATILALQREAYPERRRIIIEPYQLATRQEERYRPVRQARYNRLVKQNFSAQEARKLSTLPLTRLPFIRDMAQARKKLVSELNRQGAQLKWGKAQSRAELKAFIAYTYKQEGWEDKEGDADAWAMLRAFRQGAIDRGEYTPRERRKIWREDGTFGPARHATPAQKTKWRGLHKEGIAAQAKEYRARKREKAKK